MLRRLLAFILLLIGTALAGTAAYVYSYTDPAGFPAGATAVVLSGPGADMPGTAGETRARVDRGAALWQAGIAGRVVMSGNGTPADDVPNATFMKDRALELGLPPEAVIEEAGSHSTLQNALMTAALDTIDPRAPVIIVSHRYHLPRAWASFRWAGFPDITLVAADEGPVEITGSLLMEGLKWPFNFVRGAIASLAYAAGGEDAQIVPWLR